ncbi:MAG: hypothetical protein MZW92_05155 [Comamonadaceae bacterium]|nr:hypothetical protein [Comamonadaceae bacterium]
MKRGEARPAARSSRAIRWRCDPLLAEGGAHRRTDKQRRAGTPKQELLRRLKRRLAAARGVPPASRGTLKTLRASRRYPEPGRTRSWIFSVCLRLLRW